MADRTVDILIKATAQGTGADQAAAALQKTEAAAKKAATGVDMWTSATKKSAVAQTEAAAGMTKISNAAQVATRSANNLAQAKDAVKKSSFNAGQSMLVFGQTVQDAQYGMAAMSNQLPQLAYMLGAGAGLAGVVAIAAVGIDLLIKHVDVFGTGAKKAAADAKKLADETNMAAFKARQHTDQITAEEAAVRNLEDSLESITSAYQNQREAIDQTAAARRRDLAAMRAMEEAKTAAEMAEVDVEEATGGINAADAIIQRRAIAKEAERKRFESEQKELQATAAQAANKANSLEMEAQALRTRSKDLGQLGRGLITDQERTRLEAKQKALEAGIAGSQTNLDAEPSQITTGHTIVPGVGAVPVLGPNPKRGLLEQEIRDAQAELESLKSSTGADAMARSRVGGKDIDTLNKERADLQKQAAQKEKEAAAQRLEVENSQRAAEQRGELFPIQQSTADRQAHAKVRGIQTRQQEADAKALEKTNPAGSVEGALRGAQNGDNAAFNAIAQLLKQMAGHMKAKDAKQRQEIEQLRTLVESLREGH